LVGSARCDGDRTWLRDGGAARRGEVSPAQARAATGGALRLKQRAQKHGEELGVLTELCIEGGGRRRVLGGVVRRWRVGGARGGRSIRGRCGSQRRETARGRPERRGGAGALLGRGSGVVEGRGRGGAALLRAEKSRRRR